MKNLIRSISASACFSMVLACSGPKQTIDAAKFSTWQKELSSGKIDSISYEQLVQNEQALMKIRRKRADNDSCDESPTGHHEWRLIFSLGCCNAVYQCKHCPTYKNVDYYSNF